MRHTLRQTAVALLLIGLHWSLSLESNPSSADGIEGDQVNITFVFPNSSPSIKNEKVFSIYQEHEQKICKLDIWSSSSCHLCADGKMNSTLNVCFSGQSARAMTLLFRNLSQSNSGIYHLTVFIDNQPEPSIDSGKVNLTIRPAPNTTTVATFTDRNSSSQEQSEKIYPYLIFSSLLIATVLVLVGLLLWICRNNRIKPDEAPELNAGAAAQGMCSVSSTVPVISCVEYGVLDFQNQQNTPERHSRVEPDGGVEYAAIMFPPRKKKNMRTGRTDRGGERENRNREGPLK
ncbi:uncharacterized protein [Hoplias malabaricus]|uniref:uncharacterized protein n=1 Tax=Hoplias malabaricus TaxID=27720 RepID=UPI0034623B0F